MDKYFWRSCKYHLSVMAVIGGVVLIPALFRPAPDLKVKLEKKPEKKEESKPDKSEPVPPATDVAVLQLPLPTPTSATAKYASASDKSAAVKFQAGEERSDTTASAGDGEPSTAAIPLPVASRSELRAAGRALMRTGKGLPAVNGYVNEENSTEFLEFLNSGDFKLLLYSNGAYAGILRLGASPGIVEADIDELRREFPGKNRIIEDAGILRLARKALKAAGYPQGGLRVFWLQSPDWRAYTAGKVDRAVGILGKSIGVSPADVLEVRIRYASIRNRPSIVLTSAVIKGKAEPVQISDAEN